MDAAKSLIKRGNEVLCGEGALLKGFCNDATKGNEGKNFLLLVSLSIVFQYLVPLFIIIIMIPFIIGNLIAAGIIGISSMMNPLFLFLFVPLGVVDLAIVTVVFIAWLVTMIIYFLVNFKNIGTLAIIPIVLSFASFLIRYIPYVGPFISIVISIVPWMAIMIGVYYFIYKQGTAKGWDWARETVDYLEKERKRLVSS